MKNLSLKVKLFLVLGILTTVAIVVAFLGLDKLSGMNDRLNGIVDGTAEKVKLGGQINQNMLEINRAEKNIILAKTTEEMDEYAAFIDATKKTMQDRRKELRNLADDAGKTKLDEFATNWEAYLAANKKVRDFARLNSNAKAKALSANKGRTAYNESEKLIKQIATLNDNEVTLAAQQADAAATRVKVGAGLVQDLLRIHRAEKNVILQDTKAKMQQAENFRQKSLASADAAITQLKSSVTSEGRAYLDSFTKAYDNFRTISDRVVQLAIETDNANDTGGSNGLAEAKKLSCNEGRTAYDNAEKAMQNLVAINDQANTEAAKGVDEAATRALLAARVIQDMLAIHRAEKSLILENTTDGMDQYASAIGKLKTDLDSKVAEMEKTASDQGKVKLAAFKTAWAKFLDANEEVRTTSRENGNQKAFELSTGQGRQLADECQKLMADIVKKSNEEMAADAKASDKNYASARLLMLTVSIIGIGSGLTIGFFIVLGITRTLTRIIKDLTEGSEQVASASGQVSSASQSLAEGATEQAAGLEETSSSLEEMSSMTKQNADNAQQANTLATDARKAADGGNESMGRMSTAINDIQKSSDETAKIIKVIDEIAFQTNLLALNAAVEAARAGEAGKGFAVVAEEVRNLAMRSAEAAKNTANMIEESVKNAKNGVDISGEVGKVLGEIVGSIGKTSDLVSEIAAASSEQAQGIDQVNTAVSQMDKVTQQNAANAEESASASEELSAQAESMNDIVGQLAALVGGNSQSTNTTKIARPKSNKRNKLGKSDHVFHHVANGPTSKPEQKAAAPLAAEKTIPFDDNGGNDFKEFNS